MDWREHFGANSSKEYLLSKDQVCITINQCTYSTEQYPEMTEMLQQKLGQVGAIISQNSWKMVYAKDEAEYEQLKAEMLEKAYGLGYEEVLAYYVGQVEKLFADRALMQ